MPVRGVASWHNDWLQIYMESGLLGLAALGWLVVSVFRAGRTALRARAIQAEERRSIIALSVSLGVLFLFGGILDTLVGITFRIILGFFAVLASQPGQSMNHRAIDVHADT
jgi:O-antigen ligase